MKERTIEIRNKGEFLIYQRFLKRLFFKIDPETIHDLIVKTSSIAGKTGPTRLLTKAFFSYQNPRLEQRLAGLEFKNPLGLAAGFDKNADLMNIVSSLGFGFAEVGSITGEPCEGNPKPRLHRLVDSKSIVVNYGLKNEGAKVLLEKFKKASPQVPIGVSIAKTNCQATVEDEAGIRDYKKAYLILKDVGQYLTINISCPNTFGGMPFEDSERLERLLDALEIEKSKKPVFIKLSPDLDLENVDSILKLGQEHKVTGYICTNLTKIREGKEIKENYVPKAGGLSGKVLKQQANERISYVYQKTKGEKIIIGCGGVFSPEDAYDKIKAGASLIQLITGMIFEGPQVVSQINQGLVRLLLKGGFNSISEAVGSEFGVFNRRGQR